MCVRIYVCVYNELNFYGNDPRHAPWKGSDRYPCTRSYNKFKANEDMRDARPRLSGYVWILHGIFHARIQSPCFVLKVSKSRPLKYDSPPGDAESRVRIERVFSIATFLQSFTNDSP